MYSSVDFNYHAHAQHNIKHDEHVFVYKVQRTPWLVLSLLQFHSFSLKTNSK